MSLESIYCLGHCPSVEDLEHAEIVSGVDSVLLACVVSQPDTTLTNIFVVDVQMKPLATIRSRLCRLALWWLRIV